MYKRIRVATDGSKLSAKAVDSAIELAAPHTWPASVLPVILGTLLARQAAPA